MVERESPRERESPKKKEEREGGCGGRKGGGETHTLMLAPTLSGTANEATVCCVGSPDRIDSRGFAVTCAPPLSSKSFAEEAFNMDVVAVAVGTVPPNESRGAAAAAVSSPHTNWSIMPRVFCTLSETTKDCLAVWTE